MITLNIAQDRRQSEPSSPGAAEPWGGPAPQQLRGLVLLSTRLHLRSHRRKRALSVGRHELQSRTEVSRGFCPRSPFSQTSTVTATVSAFLYPNALGVTVPRGAARIARARVCARERSVCEQRRSEDRVCRAFREVSTARPPQTDQQSGRGGAIKEGL